MQRLDSIYFAPSPLNGRGIFTAAAIPQGALIEICPVIVMPQAQIKYLDETGLYDYYFLWGEEDEDCAIALGYGSLYNHSYTPNAAYQPDFDGNCLYFHALRPIEAGEEITVNYNGDPKDDEEVWFMGRSTD